MKPSILIEYFALAMAAHLFMACNNDIEFARIIKGKTLSGISWGFSTDSSSYEEDILVKNMPESDLEQSKIMISYFDSAGLSLNYFMTEMPEIKRYDMWFYKSTYATRKYFVKMKDIPYKDKEGYTYNGNETYLGIVYMERCKDYATRWKIGIARNLGTADNFDKQGPETEREFLQNECDPNWHGANRNNELVKYYAELRDKRNAKH